MRKLELKDIVGYLPYNLQVEYYTHIGLLVSIYGEEWNNVDIELKYGINRYEVKYIKPILHSMSDLTKFIVVKGYNNDKEFVPIQHLYDICSTPPNGYNSSDFIDESNEEWSFSDLVEAFDYDKILICLDLLNQWKFDYRNLIGEGLAIDINTLNQ